MFTKWNASSQGVDLSAKKIIVNGVAADESISKILAEKHISIELSFIDTNPNDTKKPVMVLIHGNSSSNKVFSDHIRRYAINFRVIAIDLMGHGSSTKISKTDNLTPHENRAICDAFYNPIAMVNEIKYFLEAKKIKKAHFIGWSLGGHLAYGVAVCNPELVASITTIASPPVRFSGKGLKKGFNDWFVNTLVADWVSHPRPYTLDHAKQVGRSIGFDKDDLETFSQDMAKSDPQVRKYLFLKLESYDDDGYRGTCLDGESFAHDTDIPICLIVGQNDAGINASCISEMNKTMRSSLSDTHVIENASHAVFKTHAERCYQIIDKFINKVIAANHQPDIGQTNRMN